SLTEGCFSDQSSDSPAHVTMMNGVPVVTVADGNVGVGTASPSSKLTIEGLGASTIVTIKGTASASGGNQLSINNDENIGMRFLTYGSSYTAGSLLNVGATGSVISATGANPFALMTTTAQPI